MADDVTIWYDREGDYLELVFEKREGHFRETADDRVMEKVDADGNIIAISILGVSSDKGSGPVRVSIPTHAA